ncbi:uncharacterized protein LOC144120059 [Amblyomma americanum]
MAEGSHVGTVTKSGADGNRKWTVLGACFAMNFISSALFRNSAVFYPHIMNTFLVSREPAALPLFVYGGCFHFGALLGGAIIQVVKVRTAAVAGGLLLSVSFMASYCATGTAFLTFVLGIMGGTGQGIIFNCSIVGIGDHFSSRRGLILGVVMTGAPAASFAFPALFNYALQEYGLRATLLLTGAFMFNVVLFGLLTARPRRQKGRPRPFPNVVSVSTSCMFLEPPARNTEISSISPTVFHAEVDKGFRGDKHEHRRFTAVVKPTCSISTASATTVKNTNMLGSMDTEKSILSVSTRVCSVSDYYPPCNLETRTIGLRTNVSTEPRVLSQLSHTGLLPRWNDGTVTLAQKKHQKLATATSFAAGFRLKWLALRASTVKIASKPRFYVICYSFWAYCFFLDTFLTVIVDCAIDNGLAVIDAVHVLSFFSATDALCRLLIPCLSDCNLLPTSTLLALSCVAASLLSASLPFLAGRVGFWTAALALGLPCGYLNVGLSENISAVVGKENLPMALGFASAAAAIGSFTTPFLIGFFRDMWGSYDDLFFLTAGALAAAFGLFTGIIAINFFKTRVFVLPR